MDRCRYPSKPCLNARAVKLNGDLHRFCEQHRRQANQNQMRWSKRKQTVLRTRRGGDDEGEDDGGEGSDGGAGGAPYSGLPPPPQGGMMAGPPPPMHGPPNSVTAASASLSHMSLHNHGHPHAHPRAHGHPHPHPHAHGHSLSHSHSLELSYREAGMQGANGMPNYQDHVTRGGAMPGPGGVNMPMHPGMRRDLPPGAMKDSMVDMLERTGGRPNSAGVPPIQTALPPLLPQSRAADQPDPSAVHALLMLAPNAVMSSGQPQQEPEGPPEDEDGQVRRELKRAKSNEWIARPTLSPAGLPHMPSLGPHGPPAAGIGRSASWQPREEVNESLTQFMQRKQASLPSLTNITRIEKRSYDSISTSVPMSTSAPSTSGYLHNRGPEQPTSVPSSHNSSGVHSRGVYAPLHPAPQKGSKSSNGDPVEQPTASLKRSALV